MESENEDEVKETNIQRLEQEPIAECKLKNTEQISYSLPQSEDDPKPSTSKQEEIPWNYLPEILDSEREKPSEANTQEDRKTNCDFQNKSQMASCSSQEDLNAPENIEIWNESIKHLPSQEDQANEGNQNPETLENQENLENQANQEIQRNQENEENQDNQEQEKSTTNKPILNEIEDASLVEKASINRFRTYKKLAGTRDEGREFEQAMCGYYGLKLAIRDDVDNFEMTSNDAADGKFDDIGLRITFTDGRVRRYLFQLKHKKAKSVNHSDLISESRNNDFSVPKYVASISEMDVKEDTIYILSTNAATKMRGKIQLMDEVNMEQCCQLEFEEFLVNTEKKHEHVVFEIKTDNLQQKFYLFTSQMNVKKTEDKIKKILKSLLQCEIHGSFTSFMRNWWSGNFILTKHDIIAKITELALSPYVKTVTDTKSNKKTASLKQVIMDFPLTIVEECGEDIVENIWNDEKSWTDEEFTRARSKYGLTEQQINTTLWYLRKLPFIVDVNRSNETTIKCVMNFLRKNHGNKKIVLCGQASRADFERWYTLESLSDVMERCGGEKYYSEIMQNYNVSLQGRGYITLEDLVRIDEDIAKLIGIRQLLIMSQKESFRLGNQKEELPDLHIPRTIYPVAVKMDDIISSYQSSQDTLVIVNCSKTFGSKLAENRSINTMELLDYINNSHKSTNLILLSTRNKCNNLQFETVCAESKKSNVYLLQQFDDKHCTLILRKGRKLKLEDADTTKAVKESDIFGSYNNPLQVFCAPPGMGKSTLMKVLYNTCPSDCLAISVNLINHNTFLARKPNFEKIFARFLQIDETEDHLFKRLKEHFWQKQKLYMFLDGLDEINSQYVGHVLNFVKHVSSQGGNIWVSSRENLRDMICQALFVVPVDINELDKKEQKIYISCKLEQSYESEEIEKITRVVFGNADLNNSQNLLGIPLQLHILTEMFLHDRQVYENLDKQNLFVLTKMYQSFFEGKIRFTFNKLVDRNQEQQLGHLKFILHGYELPALKTCLDKEDYKQLELSPDEEKEILRELKAEGDKYGIIKMINENEEAVFDHQTYAEYFSCVWLKKNWNQKCRDVFWKRIFEEKYQNLRLIFDVMLAENNPLHLAVIYKDMEEINNHIDDIDHTDEGGRTAFHLACSYGERYDAKLCKREMPCNVNIITRFLQEGKIPEQIDNLFGSDCVNYALQSGCLYPIEKMLEMKLLNFKKLKTSPNYDYVDEELASYSAKCGYASLLLETIKVCLGLLIDKHLATALLIRTVKGCNGDVCTPPREGNIKALKTLIENGAFLYRREKTKSGEWRRKIDILLEGVCGKHKLFDMLEILLRNEAKCAIGNTILHLLVQECSDTYCNEIVHVMNKFNIDVNATNREGKTALHYAVVNADLKIVEALMDNGADLHSIDKDGKSAWHYAASNSRQDFMKLFLDRGWLVNAQDNEGVTALHLSSAKDETAIVKMLLEQGADPDLSDNMKNNSLHHALKKKEQIPNVAKLLISGGVDLNAKNDDGYAAIHFAYMASSFEDANFLVEAGAKHDVNAKFKNGKTPLHIACNRQNWLVAINLLDIGADANTTDNDHKNPLHDYLGQNYEKVLVHEMINHGINPNTRFKGRRTLVHIVCFHGDTDALRVLVEKGADLNILDDKRQNALHVILKWVQTTYRKILNWIESNFTCRKDVVEDFFKFVHDNETMDFFLKQALTSDFKPNGKTIARIVARLKIFEMISYLIEHGSDLNKRDIFNKSAWYYALELEEEFPEIINLMKRHRSQGGANYVETSFISDSFIEGKLDSPKLFVKTIHPLKGHRTQGSESNMEISSTSDSLIDYEGGLDTEFQ